VLTTSLRGKSHEDQTPFRAATWRLHLSTSSGVKEWWVKVTTGDGKTGWVLAGDNFDGTDSLALLNLQ